MTKNDTATNAEILFDERNMVCSRTEDATQTAAWMMTTIAKGQRPDPDYARTAIQELEECKAMISKWQADLREMAGLN